MDPWVSAAAMSSTLRWRKRNIAYWRVSRSPETLTEADPRLPGSSPLDGIVTIPCLGGFRQNITTDDLAFEPTRGGNHENAGPK